MQLEPAFTVAVCGGGNLAHGTIATLGHLNPKFKINVLSRRPVAWGPDITAYTKGSYWETRGNMTGKINKCSSDAKEIVSGAQVILICSPAHTKLSILEQIRPHLTEGALVGTIFGQGGFDMQAKYALGDDIKNKNLTIFSLQYVPFICKVINYGKDINIIGPKKHLYVASYPLERVHYVGAVLTHCYWIPSVPVPGFLNMTLCPSNQIIHPGRIYGFFKDWDMKTPFEASKMPKLYEDLDDVSANEIQYLDDEIQAIKKALVAKFPDLMLPQIIPISDRICSMYDGQISDKSSLKRIFNTNTGYSRVPFPMVPVDKKDPSKVVLNRQARFFWEDVPFGLVILKDIGQIMGVKTPHCDKQIIFHQKFMPIKYVDEKTGEFLPGALKDSGAPSRYGITTPEQLVEFSLAQNSSTNNDFFFKQQKAKL